MRHHAVTCTNTDVLIIRSFGIYSTGIWIKIKWFRNMRKYINALVQDCSNSIANILELLQSCTKTSICKCLQTGDHLVLASIYQSTTKRWCRPHHGIHPIVMIDRLARLLGAKGQDVSMASMTLMNISLIPVSVAIRKSDGACGKTERSEQIAHILWRTVSSALIEKLCNLIQCWLNFGPVGALNNTSILFELIA